MKLFIERMTKNPFIYEVVFGPDYDMEIATVKRNISPSGTHSLHSIIEKKMKDVSEIDQLITEMADPTMALLHSAHPIIQKAGQEEKKNKNYDVYLMWEARMKWRKQGVELIESGQRLFNEEGYEQRLAKVTARWEEVYQKLVSDIVNENKPKSMKEGD